MSAEDRLTPRPWAANYMHLRALKTQLKARIAERLGDGPRVLDVGCGERPYEPLFGGTGTRYVGLDTAPGPGVDVVGQAESLPFDDGEFDGLLCTQVLQYVHDPAAAVREFHRVLRPGGTALVSTHGVSNAHREPPDYWRWTHLGLERLFRGSAEWAMVDVLPQGGVASAIAYLWGRQFEVAAAKAHVSAPAGWLILAVNLVAWNLDRAHRRSSSRPPDLAPSYLVVAVRAEGDPRAA